MINYSQKSQISTRKNKDIQFNFDGGNISTDNGLLLLKPIIKKLGLKKKLKKIFKKFETRQKGKIKHELFEMFLQRVLGLIAGYEDLNDHENLRNDLLFQELIGKEVELASSSTLCRFENSANKKLCFELSKLMVEFFVSSFKTAPKELVLDFDATDSIIHGNQEGRFFHGYYQNYCYLPLYVTCGSQLLVSYLRTSNIDGAKSADKILKLLVKRFRQEWPNVKIVFRGDGGFCRHKMLDWCDENNVKYIVGFSSNNRLKELSSDIEDLALKTFDEAKEKVKLFGEFTYAAKTWTKERRVITKAEYNSIGPNTRYIISNLEGDAQELYEKNYCARGDMENRIKEQQYCLFADRTSCKLLIANQFRLLLSSFAYIIMERFRTLVLEGTEMASSTCTSIRLKLIKIGGIVQRMSKKVKIFLSSAYPKQSLFMIIYKKILALE